MAADTITRRHCSQCDEWTMVPCRDCGHSARICCLKVTASNWANQLILRSNDHPTDCDSSNGEKNTCGDFGLVISPCVRFTVEWFPDGGVSCKRIFVRIRGSVSGDTNTVAGTEISHEFYTDPDWYLTPITWTQGGVTYTVQACGETDEGIDYTAADGVMLRHVRAFPSDSGTPPQTAYGTGNRLCGTGTICGVPGETGVNYSTCFVGPGFFWVCYTLEWKYSILTDLVTVNVGTGSAGAFVYYGTIFTAAYITGTWVDPETSHTIFYTSTETYQDAVGRVTGCNDTWKPNLCYGETDPPCYPCPCIRDGLSGNPVVLIFCDVETPVWTDTVSLTWNGINYQYLSGGVPEKTVTIACMDMGGGTVAYMISVNDGVTEYIWSMTGKILCDPAKSYLEMIDRTSTDPTTGDATITLFTNNTGARP